MGPTKGYLHFVIVTFISKNFGLDTSLHHNVFDYQKDLPAHPPQAVHVNSFWNSTHHPLVSDSTVLGRAVVCPRWGSAEHMEAWFPHFEWAKESSQPASQPGGVFPENLLHAHQGKAESHLMPTLEAFTGQHRGGWCRVPSRAWALGPCPFQLCFSVCRVEFSLYLLSGHGLKNK